jgi:hypothetical protein
MTTLEALQNMTSLERFQIILNYATTELKNNVVKDIFKKALKGNQDNEVLNFEPAFIVSELACKGYIPMNQEETISSFL